LEREKSNVLEEEEWAINTALFLVLSNKDCWQISVPLILALSTLV
jgi:hypothetical protein